MVDVAVWCMCGGCVGMTLVVDAANGVGAPQFHKVMAAVKSAWYKEPYGSPVYGPDENGLLSSFSSITMARRTGAVVNWSRSCWVLCWQR